MNQRILITGSSGLVGTALRRHLESRGMIVVGLDLRGSGGEAGDVRDPAKVRSAIDGCDGVVHLAAISRVVWGERDPEGCWATNVGGLRNVIEAAEALERPPWLIFASSREVYGQPDVLPATEEARFCPVNIYGRSKVEGESFVAASRTRGLRASVVRLSNVYGSVADHIDRVVPAFARAAATGGELRVDGGDHTFDFTHIDDSIRGLGALIEWFSHGGEAPPPIHFLTGQATTLGQLATLAVNLTGGNASIRLAPPRTYDVSRFYGCPGRARKLLGWEPRISIQDGLQRLITDLRCEDGMAFQAGPQS